MIAGSLFYLRRGCDGIASNKFSVKRLLALRAFIRPASVVSMSNSATLCDNTHKSYTAAQRRYRIGIDHILEWFNSHSSLAETKRKNGDLGGLIEQSL